jgi:translocator protein
MPEMLRLIVSIGVCLLAGGLGAIFTRASVGGWYAVLVKPSFTPPAWIFGPVWTLLYIMMGVALFLLWRKGVSDPRVQHALIAFAVQLALNALWSPAFFGLRSCLAGLIVIVPLWIAIAATIALAAPLSAAAALLLSPYLAWVSFAAVLNAALVLKNP